MSTRPSIQEILAAARRNGPTPANGAHSASPASPAESSPATGLVDQPASSPSISSSPSSPSSVPSRRLTLPEKLEKAAAERQARIAARTGRLTLQEKLDKAAIEREARNAARAGTGAATAESTPPAAKAPAPAPESGQRLSLQEKLAAARGTGSNGVTASAPAGSKGMSVKDKLAAARGLAPAAPAPSPPPAPAPVVAEAEPTPTPTPTTVAPPAPARTSEPKELADALRRAGERKDEEFAVRAMTGSTAESPGAADRAVGYDPYVGAGRPERSLLQIDRRGVLLFASWRVVFAGAAILTVVALLARALPR